jgi:hypothetical protein
MMTRETFLAFAVCVFYGCTSLVLGLLNKALLSSYNFSCIFTLLTAQKGLELLLCVVSRDFFKNPFGVPRFDRDTYVKSLRMGVLMVANVAIGLWGLSIVNVPMFFCIRRLVSPTIIFYEAVFLGKMTPMDVTTAIGLIFAGTIIAGWDTLNSDIIGYSITFLNNLITAASSSAQKEFADAAKAAKLTTAENSAWFTMYYTALTALPLSAALAVSSNEVATFAAFEHVDKGTFWFGFVVSLAIGPLLTYSSILCTTFNSPLAMSVTGNVKDVASTVLGAVLFPGFTATAKNVGGLGLTFVGAGYYTFIKFNESNSTKTGGPSPKEGGAQPLPSPKSGIELAEEGAVMPSTTTAAQGSSVKRGRIA